MYRVSFRSTANKDHITYNEGSELNAVKEEENTFYKVKVEESKNHRIFETLNPKNIEEHNREYVVAGYYAAMPRTETSLKVKMPKKDDDIRNFFKYDGGKASYDIPLDGLKFRYNDDIGLMTTEQVNAFLCGYASATIAFKTKTMGYASIPEPKDYFKDFDGANKIPWGTKNKNGNYIHDLFFFNQLNKSISITTANTNDRPMRMFINNYVDLKYFYENVGLIQKDKMKKCLLMYALKCPKVLKVEKVNAEGKVEKVMKNENAVKKPRVKKEKVSELKYEKVSELKYEPYKKDCGNCVKKICKKLVVEENNNEDEDEVLVNNEIRPIKTPKK
jgi:hypothetical protein